MKTLFKRMKIKVREWKKYLQIHTREDYCLDFRKSSQNLTVKIKQFIWKMDERHEEPFH